MTSWIYNIILTGSVAGQTFQRSGELIISDPIINPFGTSNDVNSFEVGILSTDPLGSPGFPIGAGSISFFTNNALVGRTPFDTAYEAYDPATNTFWIQPDRQTSLNNSLNIFTSSGITGFPYNVFDGLIAVQPQNNGSILGTIDLIGTANVGYQASFNGVLQEVIG
ncbi:MAG: hypothetical protein F6K36_01760 [Symploca sp. SIO3C6]|uniref:Uncharacterized protein n=1 Tax=Symploca sp. SIO1C4 TaxID=2607765 RepID=A0A6B3NJN3_9CYAN|nr:hypothetical protein [Symploca sp. SIO3C6]NER31980.1 hypothetical protein [Symploca sp. SIO1C4]NET04718.1 hypothetical protein [Symploca sp. SIO2B6]